MVLLLFTVFDYLQSFVKLNAFRPQLFKPVLQHDNIDNT